MKEGQLCWFELPVKDMARAQKFYSALLGWKFQDTGSGEYFMIDTGEGMSGGMFVNAAQPSEETGIPVYFSVGSMESSMEKAELGGGKVLLKKTKISDEHGYFSKIRDTEGNGVCLWSKA